MYRPGTDSEFQPRAAVPPPPPVGMMNYVPPRPMPPPIHGRPYAVPQFSFPSPASAPPPPPMVPHVPSFPSSGQLILTPTGLHLPPFVPPLPSELPPPPPPSPPPPSPPPPPSEVSSAASSLPLEPPKPRDPQMLKRIELFAAFVVKNGTHVEGLARERQGRDPKFAFLFESKGDSEAAIGHEFYKWKKQSLLLQSQSEAENISNKHLEPGNFVGQLQQQDNRRSSHQHILDEEAGLPAMLDVDMEGDFARANSKRVLAGESGSKVVEADHLDMKNAGTSLDGAVSSLPSLYPHRAEENRESLPLHVSGSNKENPQKVDILDPRRAEQRRQPNVDGSYYGARTGFGEQEYLQEEHSETNYGKFRSEQEKHLEKGLPPVDTVSQASDERPSNHHGVKQVPKRPTARLSRWGSPPPSQPVQAVNESRDHDKLSLLSGSRGREGQPSRSDSFCNATDTSRDLGGPVSADRTGDNSRDPRKPVIADRTGDTCRDLQRPASADRTGDGSFGIDTLTDAVHQQGKKKRLTADEFGRSVQKEAPESESEEDRHPLNVDEFGRLVHKGASESESEEDRRPFKRRRSYSRSRSRSSSRSQTRSSGESRWRRRSFSRSPRRKTRWSRSRSRSPQWRRSYSRTPPRDLRWGGMGRGERDWRGDREYFGRGRRGGRGTGPNPCFHYARGRCFRGAACRFLHLNREAISQERGASRRDVQFERHSSEASREEYMAEKQDRSAWRRDAFQPGHGFEDVEAVQEKYMPEKKEVEVVSNSLMFRQEEEWDVVSGKLATPCLKEESLVPINCAEEEGSQNLASSEAVEWVGKPNISDDRVVVEKTGIGKELQMVDKLECKRELELFELRDASKEVSSVVIPDTRREVELVRIPDARSEMEMAEKVDSTQKVVFQEVNVIETVEKVDTSGAWEEFVKLDASKETKVFKKLDIKEEFDVLTKLDAGREIEVFENTGISGEIEVVGILDARKGSEGVEKPDISRETEVVEKPDNSVEMEVIEELDMSSDAEAVEKPADRCQELDAAEEQEVMSEMGSAGNKGNDNDLVVLEKPGKLDAAAKPEPFNEVDVTEKLNIEEKVLEGVSKTGVIKRPAESTELGIVDVTTGMSTQDFSLEVEALEKLKVRSDEKKEDGKKSLVKTEVEWSLPLEGEPRCQPHPSAPRSSVAAVLVPSPVESAPLVLPPPPQGKSHMSTSQLYAQYQPPSSVQRPLFAGNLPRATQSNSYRLPANNAITNSQPLHSGDQVSGPRPNFISGNTGVFPIGGWGQQAFHPRSTTHEVAPFSQVHGPPNHGGSFLQNRGTSNTGAPFYGPPNPGDVFSQHQGPPNPGAPFSQHHGPPNPGAPFSQHYGATNPGPLFSQQPNHGAPFSQNYGTTNLGAPFLSQPVSQNYGPPNQPTYGASFSAQPGNQNPILTQQSGPLNQLLNFSSNPPFSQPHFPSMQQGFSSNASLLPEQSHIPHPLASANTNPVMQPNILNVGLQLNSAFSSSAPPTQNNVPWTFHAASEPSVPRVSMLPPTGQSTSYSYPLTTIPPLSGLVKVPETTDLLTSSDQYDPLSDVLDSGLDGPSKSTSLGSLRPPDGGKFTGSETTAMTTRLENVSRDLNTGKANILASRPDTVEADTANAIEAAADGGLVENVSPENWSPGPTAEEAETGQEQAQSLSKKSSRGLKMLRSAIAEHVKEVLKPTWREGYMSKEAFKTIAKKAVDKVIGNLPSHHIPKSQEKVDQYMKASRPKISKLVQGYVDKYLKL